MNDKLLQLLNEFGAELKKCDQIVNYEKSRAEYAESLEISRLVNEYNVQKSVYETESAKEPVETLLIDSIKQRMEVLYKEIMANEIMQRYVSAENDVNALFGEINHQLQHFVLPASDTSGCSSDASGCSGCSGCSSCH